MCGSNICKTFGKICGMNQPCMEIRKTTKLKRFKVSEENILFSTRKIPRKVYLKNLCNFQCSAPVIWSWDIVHKMAIMLKRIAILLVIFLGGLLTLLVIAGKEWIQLKDSGDAASQGLWEICVDQIGTAEICETLKTSELAKDNVKG